MTNASELEEMKLREIEFRSKYPAEADFLLGDQWSKEDMHRINKINEARYPTTAGEVRKAIEAHAPLTATNVNVERVMQSHNIDTDVETVRVELTYEIKRTA